MPTCQPASCTSSQPGWSTSSRRRPSQDRVLIQKFAERATVARVGARMSTPLITTHELAELLPSERAPPAVLDVRWQLATGADLRAYLEGHIPGAVFVDVDEQLADPPDERGRHPLPSAERFTDAMRVAGVSASRPVVVYDEATSMAAARAWWLLRYFGHPEVAVLDGG